MFTILCGTRFIQSTQDIANQISDTDYCTINEDTPTRVVGETITSPYNTVIHPSIINTTTWSTVNYIGSDLVPIIMELQCYIAKTYVNFPKADWTSYTQTCSKLSFKIHQP